MSLLKCYFRPQWQKPRPSNPYPACGGEQWKCECPQGPSSVRAQVASAPDWTDGAWGSTWWLFQREQLTRGNPEPRVILEIEGKPVDFLLDTGATFSVLLSALGQLFDRSIVIKGITGQPISQILFSPSGMHLGRSNFLSHFLNA